MKHDLNHHQKYKFLFKAVLVTVFLAIGLTNPLWGEAEPMIFFRNDLFYSISGFILVYSIFRIFPKYFMTMRLFLLIITMYRFLDILLVIKTYLLGEVPIAQTHFIMLLIFAVFIFYLAFQENNSYINN
jgi:hypothetical protein